MGFAMAVLQEVNTSALAVASSAIDVMNSIKCVGVVFGKVRVTTTFVAVVNAIKNFVSIAGVRSCVMNLDTSVALNA